MPVVSQEQALELLTREVAEKLPADEVLEIYNELFPEDQRPWAEVNGDLTPLVQRLVAHINGGRSISEVIDLWNLIFTVRSHKVGYDEETDGISYQEGPYVLDE